MFSSLVSMLGAIVERYRGTGVDLFRRLDGPRPVPLQTRRRESLKRPEPELDAALGGVDAIEAEARPHERETTSALAVRPAAQPLIAAAAAPAAAAAAKQARQLALQIAYHGIEIRRTFVLVGSPWITFVAVVPSHRESHFLSNTVG